MPWGFDIRSQLPSGSLHNAIRVMGNLGVRRRQPVNYECISFNTHKASFILVIYRGEGMKTLSHSGNFSDMQLFIHALTWAAISLNSIKIMAGVNY